MKLVLFAFAVLVLLWLLRGGARRAGPPSRPRADADASAPQAMLSCAQCGIHMPRDEALPGRGGVFCSDAHRTAYETAHPPA